MTARLDPSCGGLLPVISEREDQPAISDAAAEGVTWQSRASLRQAALTVAETLGAAEKRLVFLFAANSAASVAGVLGALSAGHAVALVDPDMAPDRLAALIDAYEPDWFVADRPLQLPGVWTGAGPVHVAAGPGGAAIAGPVDVLLATSGTTGSAKFVRLAAAALAANAAQIAPALDMTPEDTGIGHLALHYSYGLSVVTSHLAIGARVAMLSGSVLDASFLQAIAAAGGTQFPGVPFHYEALARLGLDRLPESVRAFTQAGGRLEPRFMSRVAEAVHLRQARFYVMYGQTEAAPRMTTLPAARLTDKPGSVGMALGGGQIDIVDGEGAVLPAGTQGEICYCGPNVMLGYAEARADLDLGDLQSGRLHTGDLGVLDDDGYLTITGRQKRFAKIAGLRLSLDEIERQLADAGSVAALDRGAQVAIACVAGQEEALRPRVRELALAYKLPPRSFKLLPMASLPRKASGKIDYASLAEDGDV